MTTTLTAADVTRTGTAFYVAPLLFEAGITSRVHEVWVVYLDRETQLQRLMARDGLSREAALSRIASQMRMEEKKKLGKIVIDNRKHGRGRRAENGAKNVTQLQGDGFITFNQ